MVAASSFAFREGALAGTIVNFTDAGGQAFNISNDKWYRLVYEFTPADNTVTQVMLYNLTDGGSAQLFFGADKASYTAGASATPQNWNRLMLRTSTSSMGTVMFDNINVIPEPAAAGMLLFGSVGILALRRFILR